MDYIQEPPPAYVRPYTGRLHVIEHTARAVEQVCREMGVAERSRPILACSLSLPFGDGDCIVILPIVGRGGVGGVSRIALERHEIAHCNGWPKDHPR